MTKESNPWDESACPTSVGYRSGCKVCWKYYTTLEEAQIASGFAKRQAVKQAERGYDFGYCSPGSITFFDPQHYAKSEHVGLYEVCFP